MFLVKFDLGEHLLYKEENSSLGGSKMVYGVISNVIPQGLKEISLDILNNLSFEEWNDYFKSCNKDWQKEIIKRMEPLAISVKQKKQLQKIKSKLA